MKYKKYSSYSAHIRKSDHVDADGNHDLHVHLYYNEGKSRRLLGRYRIPTLQPIFGHKTRELNEREIRFLRQWLGDDKQINKIQGFLKETLFDMHKIGHLAKDYGEVEKDSEGETYICVKVPVTKRIK